jgi:20S proteasome alpha/beta subunit
MKTRSMVLWKAASALLLLASVLTSSGSSAPWQDTTRTPGTGWQASSLYADLPPTVFAPGGRLLVVERVADTVSRLEPYDPSSNLVIALRCRDGVVVVTSLPQSPYLPTGSTRGVSQNSNSTTNTDAHEPPDQETFFEALLMDHSRQFIARTNLFCRLGPAVTSPSRSSVWGITAGNAVDSQILRRQLQNHAENLRTSLDDARPSILARKLADSRQRITQESGTGRILAAVAIVVSDDECWRVDVTGQFWKCRVAIAGRGAELAEQNLLDRIRSESGSTEKELSATTVQHVVSQWSSEKAQTIGRQCIREVLRERVAGKRNTVEGQPQLVHLLALTLSDSGEQWNGDENIDETKPI